MKKRKIPEQFPHLETERLHLRQLALSDAPGLFNIYSNPEVVEYILDPLTSVEGAEFMIEELNGFFELGRGIFWAIILKSEGVLIGTCSFEAIHSKSRGEIGFDLGRPWWGKGLMHEALGSVIAYGFDVLKLSDIEAITSVYNQRAYKLLTRLAFQVVAEKKGSYRMRLKRKSWE